MFLNQFLLTKSLQYDTGMPNVTSWMNKYELWGGVESKYAWNKLFLW